MKVQGRQALLHTIRPHLTRSQPRQSAYTHARHVTQTTAPTTRQGRGDYTIRTSAPLFASHWRSTVPAKHLNNRTALSTSAQQYTMQIRPIPLRQDNYGYLIIDNAFPQKGVLVDPYDVPTCQQAARDAGVTEIVANITTHHHDDHAGGNGDFSKAYPDAPIYGGSDQVRSVTHKVGKGDAFPLFQGSSITVKTYPTPCHTQDSTAFFLEDTAAGAKDQTSTHGQKAYHRVVFTGDTLFVSGCGRFFEGTPAEMHTALNKTLAALPGDTLVCCGHEYTRGNVAFSLGVLPNRAAVQELADFVRKGKNGGVTTAYFSIDDEKKHNVFMLVDDPEVHKALGMPEGGADPVQVMGKLRELKNAGKMMAKV